MLKQNTYDRIVCRNFMTNLENILCKWYKILLIKILLYFVTFLLFESVTMAIAMWDILLVEASHFFWEIFIDKIIRITDHNFFLICWHLPKTVTVFFKLSSGFWDICLEIASNSILCSASNRCCAVNPFQILRSLSTKSFSILEN